MRVFMLTMVGLLVLALAGLEVVMSALPEEPITPMQVRQELNGSALAPDTGGAALPADAAPPALLCRDGVPFEPATIGDAAAGL